MPLHRSRRSASNSISPLSISFTDFYSDPLNLSSYSDTSANIGSLPTASQRRYIFVGTYTSGGVTDGQIPNSVTINGVSATNIDHQETNDSNAVGVGIWYAEVPTGTTGVTVSMALPTTCSRGGMYYWTVYSDSDGIAVRTALKTNLPSTSPSLTNVAGNSGDVVIAIAGYYAATTRSLGGDVFSGEDFNDNIEVDVGAIGASLAVISSFTGGTVTLNENGSEEGLVVVTIKPANAP